MRFREIVEGGWASTKTQGTKITPEVMAEVVKNLPQFEQSLNAFLKQKDLPPVKIGRPVGSGTYYQRDLKQNPDKEYGDIDVQFIIPRDESLSANQNTQQYMTAVKEFANQNPRYETESGKNVIFDIGNDNYVQVDLVAIFQGKLEWSETQAPEHGTKGVLSASLYSALAEALGVSISDRGIQARTRDGEVVPFRQRKNTELVDISDNKDRWGMDLAHFFGAESVSNTLEQHPGMKQEVKIADIVGTIKGIAETLEQSNALPDAYDSAQELLNSIRTVYQNKIDAVINSSKFDKAESPAAKKKAEETKQMLRDKSEQIASQLK
jgi:hypothetical protein